MAKKTQINNENESRSKLLSCQVYRWTVKSVYGRRCIHGEKKQKALDVNTVLFKIDQHCERCAGKVVRTLDGWFWRWRRIWGRIWQGPLLWMILKVLSVVLTSILPSLSIAKWMAMLRSASGQRVAHNTSFVSSAVTSSALSTDLRIPGPMYVSVGDCNNFCEYRGASFWFEERLKSSL